MTAYLATFHNNEDNMTSVVFESNHKAGGYGVAIRDDDSGNFAPVSHHGFKTFEAAVSKAKEILQ